MKLFFTVVLMLLCATGFAQNVYYLKFDGRYVKDRDSADYTRVVSAPDSASKLYNVAEFYLNGKPKLTGKSSTTNPCVFEGACVGFYANGNKATALNYEHGILKGMQYYFYPNGKAYQVDSYPDGDNSTGPSYDRRLINAEYDSLGTAIVIGGNGYYKGYDDKFKEVIEEGNLKGGKKDGLWKGGYPEIHFTEKYENGNFISGVSVSQPGDTVKYNIRESEPQFKGGIQAFYKYLGKNIIYPKYEKLHNIQGRVIVLFIIEKDGKVSDVKILNSVSENIDNEAVRVIRNSPDWIAGVQYGRNVRVEYTVPLSFTLSN
jgi:TonB family protein